MSQNGSARSSSRLYSSSELASGSWVRTGIELSRVEAEQLWSEEARSFTEWVKALALKTGIKDANYWRYIAAIRFFPELRQKLIDDGRDCPSLEELSDAVSPENIELLTRLVRVMPAPHFAELGARVLNRTATRRELRATWDTYRPALGGKTARGKGVLAPTLNHANPAERSKFAVAQARLTLEASPQSWVCEPAPVFFRAINNLRIIEAATRANSDLDIVAAIKRSDDASLELHGIEIRLNFPISAVPHITELGQWVNYLWVAFTKPVSSSVQSIVPAHVGILVINDGGISVVRAAESTKPRQEAILATTQHFLHRALAR